MISTDRPSIYIPTTTGKEDHHLPPDPTTAVAASDPNKDPQLPP